MDPGVLDSGCEPCLSAVSSLLSGLWMGRCGWAAADAAADLPVSTVGGTVAFPSGSVLVHDASATPKPGSAIPRAEARARNVRRVVVARTASDNFGSCGSLLDMMTFTQMRMLTIP